MSQLDQLIAQYNAAEDVQAQRLEEIFDLLEAQQPPRRLVVGDTAFTQFDKFKRDGFVTATRRKVTSWAEGVPA